MNIGNFRSRLKDTAFVLATHPSEIKTRLELAILDHFLLANVVESNDVPLYFQDKHAAIMDIVSKKDWGGSDRIRATLHGKHGKTLSQIATEIFILHSQFEEYLATGFVPDDNT